MTSATATPSLTEESSLLDRARRVFPGGVLATFRLPDDLEFVTARASGSHVFGSNGVEYIDYMLGSGPMIVGHAHPAVTEAIRRQAELGTTYYTLNRPAIELAERILEVFPSDSSILLTSSGSEATFYALRLARAFTGRRYVVKFSGAYHGHQDYAMPNAFATQWKDGPTVLATAGVPEEASSTVLVAQFNDLSSLERLFELHGAEIAAVTVEPYQRVLEPEPGFLADLTRLAHAHGALVVADEVVTGFRFHYGTAQQLFGFEADLSALGKIIGGGLPVAAVVGRREVLALADSRTKSVPEYVYFSGTLNGYALGAAAGVATLDVLRAPGSYDRLNDLGDAVRKALRRRIEVSGIKAAVVGRGPMFHVLFNPPPTLTRASDIAASDLAAGARFGAQLIRGGLLVNPVQRSYISLAHTDEDVAQSDHVFGEAIASTFGG